MNIVSELHNYALSSDILMESARRAFASPTMFLLLVVVLLDVFTGVGATLINKKGLDSSISFKGFVKHSVVLFSCFLVEAAFLATFYNAHINPYIMVFGHIITLLAITSYVPSLVGNVSAMGVSLPEPVKIIFKQEIARKLEKYKDEGEL